MSSGNDDIDNTQTTLRRDPLVAVAAPSSRLRIVHSPDTSLIDADFVLDGSEYVFGRSSEAANTTRDQRMSRRHVRLSRGRDGYLVEDLETTNGTFLDGRKIKGRVPLAGNVLSAGDTIFVVDHPADRDLLPSSPNIDGSAVLGVVGVSAASRALRRSIATVARTDGTVTLLGPTGAGKEVTAHAIHAASGRTGEFVPVNCAAIPAHIAEAELFGHKKGAFTGAEADRTGYFGLADGGTLFLDEVGDLPTPVQAKLLRVLEDRTIQPLGGGSPMKVDVRIIAATHIDLENTDFRRDLLARLSDWVLHLPALGSRRADVIPLFQHFLRVEFPDRQPRAVSPEFYEALLLYDWPMNARELRKLAKRIENLAGDDDYDLSMLPASMRAPLMARFSEGEAHPRAEPTPDTDAGIPTREELETALGEARGNVKLAAQNRGWHRTQLYRWLRRLEIDPSRFR